LIVTDRYLFTKIELADYDIVIPFVCCRDGDCCRSYMPHISEKDLSDIADFLGRPSNGLFLEYMICLRKNATLNHGPCIFLTSENICLIYTHPLRPQVCRLYPFSYGTKTIECSGYRDHERFVTAFLSGQSRYDLYDASFCPNRSHRSIPKQNWDTAWHILGKNHASSSMKAVFKSLNRTSLPL
jgi:Fe-S-cluster containining protein